MGHELPEFTDRANCGGVSGTITIPAGAIVEAKVGSSTLSDRELIDWQALDTGVKWGLENTVAGTSADSFKSQTFTRPYGYPPGGH